MKSRWIIAAAATFVVALAIAVYVREQPHRANAVRVLIEASERIPSRQLRARLSQESKYRPYAGVVRGSESSTAIPFSVYATAAEVRDAADRQPNAEHLHALAVAFLLTDDAERAVKSADEAIRRAGSAVDIPLAIERCNDALLLVDVAAAHLERTSDRPIADLLIAFSAADRATRLQPRMHEAMFDRALALEKLSLHAEASSAWQAYLRADRDSGWSAEARQSLESLNAKTLWQREAASLSVFGVPEAVLHDSQRAREFAEERLLPEWGRLWLAGDTANANTKARAVMAIGDLLSRVTADRSVAGEAETLADAERRSATAAAYAAYGTAFAEFRTAPSDGAAAHLRSAALALDRVRSPLARRGRMYACAAMQYSGRNAAAIAEARRLLDALGVGDHGYPSIEGQLRWIAGLASMTVGDPEQALEHYEAARSAFTKDGDRANLAGVAAARTECLTYLGYDDDVWQQEFEAIDLSGRDTPPLRRYLVLTELMELARSHHLPAVARSFERELSDVARATGDPAVACSALLTAAQNQEDRGETAAALQTLSAAERASASVSATGSRDRLNCRIALQRASVLSRTDSRAALSSLAAAEHFASGLEYVMFGPEIHLRKGEAFFVANDRRAAIAEAREGLNVYRRIAPSVNLTDRAMFAAVGKNLADLEIRCAVDSDEPVAWRAVLASHDEWGSDLATRSRSDALLVYHVLDDRLLIWVIRGAERHLVTVRINSSDVRNVVDELVRSTRGSSSFVELRPTAERAFDLLIRPIVARLTGATRIFILPDSNLDDVPFSVLTERESGRTLIEQWPIALLGPRAKIASPQPERLSRQSLFIAAEPLVKTLPRLPGARAESGRIANEWPASSMITGDGATKSAFIAGALSHGIVHFAGHVTHASDPSMAALRLAPVDADDGRLTAMELVRLSAHPPSLVVLSACSGGIGRRSALGPLSMARQFALTGVPYVVAPLWDVDDGRTTDLMVAFYAALRRGDPPEAAMRNAQLLSSRRQRPPRDWAVFETFVHPNDL